VVTIRNESLIPRGRNTAVAHFLASDATHLVFIDSDIGFPWQGVFRLMAHGRPLVGATYARKHLGAPSFAFVPLERAVPADTQGLVEVHSLPTGFMCIARDTVQRLVGAYAGTRYGMRPGDGPPGAWRDNLFDLFGLCRDGMNYWSEDYAFCQRWRGLIGKCWLDPNILLEHHGTACFTGDPRVALAPPPPPRRWYHLLRRRPVRAPA
jgi:hypothetical protein